MKPSKRLIDSEKLIHKYAYFLEDGTEVVKVSDIKSFPSVPNKSAKWQHTAGGQWFCPACGTTCCYDDGAKIVPNRRGIKFCPNCGAEFGEYKPEIPKLD